jgi:hypothetical protein
MVIIALAMLVDSFATQGLQPLIRTAEGFTYVHTITCIKKNYEYITGRDWVDDEVI